jgi:hypothetical protein
MRLSFANASMRAALAVATLAMSVRAAGAGDLFNNTNIYGVSNGPSRPTTFSLSSAATITQVVTYHWNSGLGALPGTIFLQNNQSGQRFMFAAASTSGQNGVRNVNWISNANVTIPAGIYTVLDSSQSTWSYNQQSGNAGFAIVRGTPAPQPPVPYGGNCHGAGCVHPDFRSMGGDAAYGVGKPVSVHVHFNASSFYWIVFDPPATSLAMLQQQCTFWPYGSGHLVLLDDEPYYYYFIGEYSRFGCAR